MTGPNPSARTLRIVGMVRQGMSPAQIADATGYDRSVVRNALQYYRRRVDPSLPRCKRGHVPGTYAWVMVAGPVADQYRILAERRQVPPAELLTRVLTTLADEPTLLANLLDEEG